MKKDYFLNGKGKIILKQRFILNFWQLLKSKGGLVSTKFFSKKGVLAISKVNFFAYGLPLFSKSSSKVLKIKAGEVRNLFFLF